MSGEDFLATMASASARRARALMDTTNDDELMARAMAEPAPPGLSLQCGGFDIFAEIKLRSPAAGQLAAAGEDLQARAALYAGAGACAVSVLTEPDRFGGSEADLARVALALASADVPAMAKDFLVEPCQIAAARIAGAGGVLLIMTMLEDAQCARMIERAIALGMFVLLETFDATDLDRAGALLASGVGRQGQVLLGLNSRDLRNLEVDSRRLLDLADRFPEGWPRVAESGLSEPRDATAMAAAGYDAGLVGTALMRAPAPDQLIRRMREAGTAARESAA